MDDFKDAGAYSLFNIEGNNVPTSWAQLLVFSSGYYITQIIVDVSSCKLFIRRYDIENDRWQEWGNIIMTYFLSQFRPGRTFATFDKY